MRKYLIAVGVGILLTTGFTSSANAATKKIYTPLNPKMDPKINPKMDPKLNPNVDPRLNPNVDPRFKRY